MQKTQNYDVIVIGGGHAGCEAAGAAARMGAKTALITMKLDKIGEMSCNPAIGGLGKGQLVREIDALDGLMGKAADQAGIQFRMLNKSRGPAVQGPRTQADRQLYKKAIQNLLKNQPHLTLIEGAVGDIEFDGDRVMGIVTETGAMMMAPAIILTTGTFLGGVIHLGEERVQAGRFGEKPSVKLAKSLKKMGLKMGRLKTGTPPRLSAKTIDWDRLEKQPADDILVPFSSMTEKITVPQISCGITHTPIYARMRLLRLLFIYRRFIRGRLRLRGRVIARLLRIKFFGLRIARIIKFFWNQKGCMMTRSIPMGFRQACPEMCKPICWALLPGWNGRRFCNMDMRLNMILSIREACRLL